MPSGGMPNIARIIAITGKDPPGTPAAPTLPRMHSTSTSNCCSRVSSTPKNCARKSTVTPSNSAVPFMLAVAPRVHTKRATWRGAPRRSSAAFRVVGRVALLDEVENAVSMTGWTCRKNHSGDTPARVRSRIGNTTNMCTARASTTVPT